MMSLAFVFYPWKGIKKNKHFNDVIISQWMLRLQVESAVKQQLAPHYREISQASIRVAR